MAGNHFEFEFSTIGWAGSSSLYGNSENSILTKLHQLLVNFFHSWAKILSKSLPNFQLNQSQFHQCFSTYGYWLRASQLFTLGFPAGFLSRVLITDAKNRF